MSGVAVKGVHEGVDVLYRIAIYDTTDGGLDNMGASDLSDVHLVLFVMEKGRFTRKDKDIIDSIFECLEKCVSQISALVLLGCEGKDDTIRHSIVKDFSDASNTKYVADFMGQNIYGVGFVDISETKEELREEYERSMKEDEKTLRDVVMKHSTSVEVKKMLKQKMSKKKEVQVVSKPGPTLELVATKLKDVAGKLDEQQRKLDEQQRKLDEQRKLTAELHKLAKECQDLIAPAQMPEEHTEQKQNNARRSEEHTELTKCTIS